MSEQGAGKRSQLGQERLEPGQSTRTVDPAASGDTVDVARQQGSSQRGYTGDNPQQYEPPQPPGAKVTGDPGRTTHPSGPPLGSAPGYGDITEGHVGDQGTEEPPVGPSVGGEESHSATRRIGQDEGKGSQGFGNE